MTEKAKAVLDFIKSEQREKGITPSTREIQQHIGAKSQTSVMQYLNQLKKEGLILRSKLVKARHVFIVQG